MYRPPSSLRYPEGAQPFKELEDRPDSPHSSSSSRSDLSSPSFNRDSEFEFGSKQKQQTTQPTKLEKEEGGGSFENESDSNSTTTAKTILSGQTTSKESLNTADGERRRLGKTTVRICFFYFYI